MNYCAIKTNSGFMATNNAPTGGLPPIARWDVVPYQRINAGETLNLGVVAFSKNGIDRVTFSITGQGYSGGNKVTAHIALNPQSGVWEYWVPLSVGEFTSDGQITVEATVQGKDWGIRDRNTDGGGLGLDSLVLFVNPNNTLPSSEAWVDLGGNDDTGTVNKAALPYKSVMKALVGIKNWNSAHGYGAYADGGIIRVNPGTHVVSQEGVWGGSIPTTLNEWVTITNGTGSTVDNTTLNGDGAIFNTKHLRFKGVTVTGFIEATGGFGPTAFWWSDACTLVGAGQWSATMPIGGNVGSIFYMDSSISLITFPTRNGVICRGLTIQHIGGDAFQNIPMIVNCTVDDIHPGITGEHADGVQFWGGVNDNNAIVYNLKGTNLHYQGWNILGSDGSDPDPAPSVGIAFVNVFLKLVSPVIAPGGYSGWGRACTHLLLWGVVLTDDGIVTHEVGIGRDLEPRWEISNFSMKGCVFSRYLLTGGWDEIDYSDTYYNHYVSYQAGAGSPPGTLWTTGNAMLDSNGKPISGSPLLNRVTPLLTPIDVEGNLRICPGSVGAFE